VIQEQRRNYAYLIDYRPYTSGLMAAGFSGYPRFGLAAAYRANNRRDSADYLAAAESFSPLLAGLKCLNRPGK
jgi:hypothetical protein